MAEQEFGLILFYGMRVSSKAGGENSLTINPQSISASKMTGIRNPNDWNPGIWNPHPFCSIAWRAFSSVLFLASHLKLVIDPLVTGYEKAKKYSLEGTACP